MNINEKLKKVYAEHWESLLNELYALDTPDEYTSPLLLKFSDNYFNKTNYRIMFFGQETRGWQKKEHNQLKSIDSIMDGYQRYLIDNNMKYRDETSQKMISRSSFRTGVLNLKKGLKKRKLEVDLIWNNINKIGKHNEKVGINSKVSLIEFEEFNVIKKEVEILNPDFYIFFTGPSRDKEILRKFPDLFLETHHTLSTKELVLFKDSSGKIIGLRTYHPNYLKGFYKTLEPFCLDIIDEALKNKSVT